MEISEDVKTVHKKAVEALSNSHSPYSQLKVAAGLKLSGCDEIICGVNVENASYGATICAERSALCSSISQFGTSQKFSFIVVISTFKGGPIPPCGMCLQFLQEFVAPDFPVYLGDEKSLTKKYLFSELVPHGFQNDMLPQ